MNCKATSGTLTGILNNHHLGTYELQPILLHGLSNLTWRDFQNLSLLHERTLHTLCSYTVLLPWTAVGCCSTFGHRGFVHTTIRARLACPDPGWTVLQSRVAMDSDITILNFLNVFLESHTWLFDVNGEISCVGVCV